MKVIILAAGMGNRLKDVLKGKPKSLFEIKGKSLLEYSLEALLKNGIDEVSIAVGFKSEQIRNKIGDNFRGIKILYNKNESYETTGSMHSLYKSLRKPEDCLVLDGDIIYDPKSLREILKCKEKDVVLLTNCRKSKDEVYVTLGNSKRIAYLGKQLPLSKKIFEFTGISKFSKNFVLHMIKLHREKMKKGEFEEYYEDCAYRANKIMPWYGLVKENLAWSEVDKKEDIKRAMRVLERLGSYS